MALVLSTAAAHALGQPCAPRKPLPAINLTTPGPCRFDPATMSFAGSAAEQASCLLRPINASANLDPAPRTVPKVLADRVGSAALLPARAGLEDLLAESGLDALFRPALSDPVSRARDNDPQAPLARYFVIHDTSTPKLAWFPVNVDGDIRINSLDRFRCSDNAEMAHAFINRSGALYLGHDFGVPWRATKFERAVSFGTNLKGLFLHVELIQPRTQGPGRRPNDFGAPLPGFSAAQYDRLALLYTIASLRAGAWLIPAFHVAIDADIRDGHDDPRNFDLDSFAGSLENLLARLSAHEMKRAGIETGGKR